MNAQSARNAAKDKSDGSGFRAVRRASGLLLLAVLSVTASACQTNPFASRLRMESSAPNGRSVKVEIEGGVLTDTVQRVTVKYEMTDIPDGEQTVKLELSGNGKADTGNQFRALDSIVGFLAGIFAGAVAP